MSGAGKDASQPGADSSSQPSQPIDLGNIFAGITNGAFDFPLSKVKHYFRHYSRPGGGFNRRAGSAYIYSSDVNWHKGVLLSR